MSRTPTDTIVEAIAKANVERGGFPDKQKPPPGMVRHHDGWWRRKRK